MLPFPLAMSLGSKSHGGIVNKTSAFVSLPGRYFLRRQRAGGVCGRSGLGSYSYLQARHLRRPYTGVATPSARAANDSVQPAEEESQDDGFVTASETDASEGEDEPLPSLSSHAHVSTSRRRDHVDHDGDSSGRFAGSSRSTKNARGRTSRDPHVASQSAYQAHMQSQHHQHQQDPTAAVWRRQNSTLVDQARRYGVDSAVDMLWELNDDGRAVSQNFNQVVSLLSGAGRLEDGLDLAREAGKRSLANIITFRPLMKLCCSTGDGKSAKRVWRSMVDCGVDGDMFLYAEFMGALVRSQDLTSAERVIESLQDSSRRPHVVLYNTLLKGYAKQANVEAAFVTLERLVGSGVYPDETTFNTILNTCVRAKDLEALNKAMQLMREHQVKPGVPTFNTLLKLYARAGKFEDALDIFNEMQETVEPSIVTFNTLIDGCAHRGDMEQAAAFFDEMVSRGMEPDICTMTSLLKGFGRSNNPKRAVELYEAMKDGGYEIEERTRYAVINACLRGNDRENAKRLMDEMIQAKFRIRARTWVWLLETDIWCDDEDGAIATLREMLANGAFLDTGGKSALLREARSRGGFLRFQRELKASRVGSSPDRRRRC